MSMADGDGGLSSLGLLDTLFRWAKVHGIGFWQTLLTIVGIFSLRWASKFIGRAKDVVGGVHQVYEQLLLDQRKANDDMRKQLDEERALRRKLNDELELERFEKQTALRHLARTREKLAAAGLQSEIDHETDK